MGSEHKDNLNEVCEVPEKKEKKKKKKFLLILLPFFIIFLVIVIGVAGFVGYKFSLIQFDDNETTTIDSNKEFVDEEKFEFDEIDDATGRDFREILKNWATNGGEKISQKEVLNILLIGSDASSKDPNRANVTDKGNTDVMMLVSINPVKKTIKLVSFKKM